MTASIHYGKESQIPCVNWVAAKKFNLSYYHLGNLIDYYVYPLWYLNLTSLTAIQSTVSCQAGFTSKGHHQALRISFTHHPGTEVREFTLQDGTGILTSCLVPLHTVTPLMRIENNLYIPRTPGLRVRNLQIPRHLVLRKHYAWNSVLKAIWEINRTRNVVTFVMTNLNPSHVSPGLQPTSLKASACGLHKTLDSKPQNLMYLMA